MKAKRNIFISHASADVLLANQLKKWIEHGFNSVNAFVASHWGDVPAGSLWERKIQRALKGADAVVTLVTERSLNRHWIWFELGASWMAGRKVIPLCFEDISYDRMGPLLGAYQHIRIDGPAAVRKLVAALRPALGAYKGPDFKTTYAMFNDACTNARWISISGRPWERVRFKVTVQV